MHTLRCFNTVLFIVVSSFTMALSSYAVDETASSPNAPKVKAQEQDLEQKSTFAYQEYDNGDSVTAIEIDSNDPNAQVVALGFLTDEVERAKDAAAADAVKVEIIVNEDTSPDMLEEAAKVAKANAGQIVVAPAVPAEQIEALALTQRFRERMNEVDKKARSLAKAKTDAIAAVRGRGLGGAVVLSMFFLKNHSITTALSLGMLCYQMSRRLGQENSFILRWLPTWDTPPSGAARWILEKAGYHQAVQFLDGIRKKTAPGIWKYVKISGLVFGYLSTAHLLKCMLGEASLPWNYEDQHQFITSVVWPSVWGTIAEASWMSFNSIIYNEKLDAITRELFESGNTEDGFDRAVQRMVDEVIYADSKAASVSIGSTSAQLAGGSPVLIAMGSIGLLAKQAHVWKFGVDVRKIWSRLTGLEYGKWSSSPDNKRGWLSAVYKAVDRYVFKPVEGPIDWACNKVFGEIPAVE